MIDTTLDRPIETSACAPCHVHYLADAHTVLDTWVKSQTQKIDRRTMRTLVDLLATSDPVKALVAGFESRTLYPSRPAIKLETPTSPTVWLLGFRPGESTDVHDHALSEAAIHVYSGEIEETIYWPQEKQIIGEVINKGPCKTVTRELATPSTISVPTPYTHKFAGNCVATDMLPLCAVSIHAYYPQLKIMNLYRVDEANETIEFSGSWEDNG